MEYTKGEWEIVDETQVFVGDRLVANTGGFSANYLPARLENIANAHLIAAAPEMYEALKAADEGYEKGAPNENHIKIKIWEAIAKVGK